MPEEKENNIEMLSYDHDDTQSEVVSRKELDAILLAQTLINAGNEYI
jgi:hypothetical protein